jgi:hypothetical protein
MAFFYLILFDVVILSVIPLDVIAPKKFGKNAKIIAITL